MVPGNAGLFAFFAFMIFLDLSQTLQENIMAAFHKQPAEWRPDDAHHTNDKFQLQIQVCN